ncbi:type-1 angiotensin II receptor B-like [Saccostrea cucullata]|uniref:type-1 angiotensin II receptor B-like n=1 Tax=Saccostrea cuccullata TaxID=36930 RepID=UPI002ED1E9F9
MEDAETLSEEYSKALLPNTIIQLIMAALGVFGNCLVLLMYTKYVEDNKGSRYFIPVLALVDLIGTASNVTGFYVNDNMRYTYGSEFLCIMFHFSIVLTGGFSAHLTFAISLQRYLMICRPFGQQLSNQMRRVVILIIFLISIGYATPVIKFDKIYTSSSTGNFSTCATNMDTYRPNGIVQYLGILLFFSVINIFVTSVLYIPVIKTIYRRRLHVSCNQQSNVLDGNINTSCRELQTFGVGEIAGLKNSVDTNDENNKTSKKDRESRKNISVMYLVIIIVYVVSNVTSLVIHIYYFTKTEEIKGYKRNIYFLFMRFQLVNHIANPYIYWYYDRMFRKELRRFCCDKILKK